MSKRCQCCHRYAPKAVLGTDDAGEVIQGEPTGECRGHAAIEEARKWAKTWKARALEMGYGQVKVRVDPNMPPNSMALESSIDRVTVVNLGPNPQLLMEDKALVARHPDIVANMPTLVDAIAQDLEAEAATPPGDGPEWPAVIRSDWMRIYGRLPTWDNDKASDNCACAEVDLQCFRHCETCYSLLKVTDPKGGPVRENLHCAFQGCAKFQAPLTNDEKLHAKWIEEGKELAYCQGPRRHFFIVGSPMWDQLVETGCFHCGALPEASR